MCLQPHITAELGGPHFRFGTGSFVCDCVTRIYSVVVLVRISLKQVGVTEDGLAYTKQTNKQKP